MVKPLLLIPFEVQPYLDRLERDNVKLKYILKRIFTLISGHLDLSKKTGAPIVYGKMQTRI
jgi:hypothetical protein